MSIKEYDERRNLGNHKSNLEARIKADNSPEGNCEACAAVTCLCNVTSAKALMVLEKNLNTKEIEIFQCDDKEEDPDLEGVDLCSIG